MYYAWCEYLMKRKCRVDSMHNQELSLIMATQFVKWWKTKFHVGGCSYKSISVLGSNVLDGRRSDTEELVRDDTSCNGHINPGLASSSVSEASAATPQYLHQHSTQVKFEDFECDVQVEGCEGGEEKKEFSFTFYDLDGHGKITKDDIAGLVRSIYGAVNDSITVPQGGKKTIKVRLTVTPEKGGRKEDLIQEPEPASNNNINNNNLSIIGMGNSSSNDRPRNNVNVTIKENLNRDRLGGGSARREKELRDKLSHLDRPKFHSVRLPNQCRGCNVSPDVCASPLRNRKKWRERCSLQRPDIFELLQANMEKNNVNPCCRREHPQLHHQHSIAPCTNSQETCPVLPLLNDNFCKSNSFRQQYPTHFHRSSHNHSHHHQHQHQCRKQHHRSRSHDLSQNLFRHHSFNERDQNQCCNLNSNLETQDPLDILEGFVNHQFSQNRNKNTNLAAAQASATPHQLKHRNRQQEHERAMAQVISWLERENIGGYEKKFGAKRNNPSTNSLLGSPPQVKKHEHHHVHEHIHHHYHHHFGKETPIIV